MLGYLSFHYCPNIFDDVEVRTIPRPRFKKFEMFLRQPCLDRFCALFICSFALFTVALTVESAILSFLAICLNATFSLYTMKTCARRSEVSSLLRAIVQHSEQYTGVLLNPRTLGLFIFPKYRLLDFKNIKKSLIFFLFLIITGTVSVL
jgi:hypothetical protein